jgi:hypothetical protein
MGVFRVECIDAATASGELRVRVQHAEPGSDRDELPLEEFLGRCDGCFAGSGRIVDQLFQARHTEGMVRCYRVQDRVVGFDQQFVTALPEDSYVLCEINVSSVFPLPEEALDPLARGALRALPSARAARH